MTEPTDALRHGTDHASRRADPSAADNDEVFRRRSRALGDPTRLAIYRAIARREAPVGVAELVDEFGLNHNTVRQHLARLREAELLEELGAAPRGPGRPRLLYRLTPDAAADWNGEAPYERLSLLLLEVVSTGRSPLEVGRSAGRAATVDPTADDPVAALAATVTAQGFAPTLRRSDGEAELTLRHCPYAAAAELNADVVCAVHRGMAEGLVEQISGVASARLEAREPRGGRCLFRLEVDPGS